MDSNWQDFVPNVHSKFDVEYVQDRNCVTETYRLSDMCEMCAQFRMSGLNSFIQNVMQSLI